jgi:alkanesulfonate monooxygenase SsuD/methylene tetrahydromethanopterin reductase-like flavin-dependent oxidoreductase (luciferase family)
MDQGVTALAERMEAGIQLHLPTFKDYPLPELLQMARAGHAGGLDQIWVTDNLQHRNPFVVLAALAGAVPIKLGTAVLVQYFRNPLEAANSVATVSELMDGRELDIGIARGNANTPRWIQTPKVISALRETAQSLRGLLDGETIAFRDYPTLAEYFNFVPEAPFRLDFSPHTPVRLYCGGNGPLSLEVGGRYMDGIVFGSTVLTAARTGRLPELLDVADEAASEAGRPSPLPRVAEIKISLASDRTVAREFVKGSVGSRIRSFRKRGYTDEDFRSLGIEPRDVDRLEEADRNGAARADFAPLVTDAMIDAIFVAGDPASCREQMQEVCATVRTHGFHQIMFSELGPDAPAALKLLTDEILPVVR